MELIVKVQLETRRIVVIAGTAAFDLIYLGRAQEAAHSLTGRVEFEFWSNRSMAEVRQAVATLAPRTAVLFTTMFRDAAGEAFIPAHSAPVTVRADERLPCLLSFALDRSRLRVGSTNS